ncbi:uncharacterized protein LOC133717979 [Rosa rugosa]|uniref:uncharacterized protein LOC133717979 n=1 Tax=Rosa rugosa TaxID=74645 RepID=UPI002B407553|nr:uncharacterized protein LOC133717979 [Rosa rugosa]
MWHMLATMRQNLQNMRKSPRVADESMVNIGGGNLAVELPIIRRSSSRGWKGFSVIVSVVILPFSVLSCFSQPHVHGADGVWASGDFAQITEMNHLMVCDSMRYAILM